jgi:GntR family transcriptional regulator
MQRIPKYYSIGRQIIAQIQSGRLQPGMRAPSENEIMAKHGVSNTTARKILNEIEAAGWVSRIKGKGTFVQKNDVERSANKILSFTRNMIEAGHEPRTTVLDSRTVPGGYSAVINNRRYTMHGPACKIHRLRFADNVPMMLEVRYISLDLCPRIDQQDFGGSLSALYHHQLTEINQMLSATMIEGNLLDFFDLHDPIPAIKVESVTFCAKEMILEMESSIYRGDKYRFSVRATP